MTGRACLLILVLIFAAPALAEDDQPGEYAGRDARWWVGQLSKSGVREAALAAFRKMGRPALEPLGDALLSADRRTREGALLALQQLSVDPTPILGVLIEALGPAGPGTASRILSLIRRTGRSALPHLEVISGYLHCGDPAAASRALEVLGGLAPESRSELDRVLALTRDAKPRLRRQALEAAMRMGPDNGEVVKALALELTRSGDRDREALLKAAAPLSPDAPGFAALIVRQGQDSYAPARAEVAMRLQVIVANDPTRLGALTALLQDADSLVRRRAAGSIRGLGSVAAPAAEALTRLLGNADSTDDLPAIEALAGIGPAAASALPTVLDMIEVREPSEQLKYAVAKLFAGTPAVAMKALCSEEAGVRDIGLRVVSCWSPEVWKEQVPAVLDPLEVALRQVGYHSQWESGILQTLSLLSAEEPRVVSLFVAMARARCPETRRQAALYLAARERNVPRILELVSSPDAAEREFALLVFASGVNRHGESRALAGLMCLLHSEDVIIREQVGRFLVQRVLRGVGDSFSDRDGAALAAAAVALLNDPELGYFALRGLGSLGSYALPHLDALFALLSETGPNSRNIGAAFSLREIARSGEEAAARVNPRLLLVFKGDDPVAAAAAANGLNLDPEYDRALLSGLPELIRDPRTTVHSPAVAATGAMKERAVSLVPVLLEIVTNPPSGSHIDTAAICALDEIIPDDERVIRIAITATLDPEDRFHKVRYRNVLFTGGKNTTNLLAESLATASPRERILLLGVLGSRRAKSRAVIDRIRPFLTDPNCAVSEAARNALYWIEQEE